MGVLDAPTIVSAHAGSVITHELANAQRNVNMCVISDSTGVDTVEQTTGTDRRWVYLLAQLLGLDFLSYTVLHRQWNATNQNYDAATTIQTGNGTNNAGGPFTLTVYGATKSGATAAYWITEFVTLRTTILPVQMDLILLADGHNEVGHGSDVRGTLWNLLRCVMYNAPGVQIGWVTQNPQYAAASGSTTTLTEQNNQLLRMEEVRKLARSEGVALIDVQPAFLADATYGPDLIATDGIHPNAAGSVLWAAQVKRHFPKARSTSGIVVGGPIAKPSRVWIPATAFSAILGAPTATNIQNVPVWALAQSVDSIISTTADWPASWQTVNIYVGWVLASSEAAHAWRCRVGQQRIAGTFEPAGSGGATLAAPAAGSLTTITGRNANVVGWDIKYTGTDALTGFTGRPMMFQVERLGTDGADTITQAVNILGIMIERAS